MVELTKVRFSNKQIATTLPHGLVAVFVGATSGIGELAMRAFVQVCEQIRANETAINLLFQSQGSLATGSGESLHLISCQTGIF